MRSGGSAGGPRAYQYQFSGFKSHFVGSSCIKLNCGKRESVSWQYSMKIRRAVGMLNPIHDKNEGTYVPGGKRDDTCDHDLSSTSLSVKPPTS